MAASIISRLDRCKPLALYQKIAACTIGNRWPCVFPQSLLNIKARNVSTSSLNFVKRIEETTTGDVTVIEGVIFEPAKKAVKVFPTDDTSPDACPLCRLNLKLQHTDVLILSQFLNRNGLLLSRRVTGLCGLQQKIVESLVAQAQKAGLMSNLNPHHRTLDPSKRWGYKKFNRYFDPGQSGIVIKKYK